MHMADAPAIKAAPIHLHHISAALQLAPLLRLDSDPTTRTGAASLRGPRAELHNQEMFDWKDLRDVLSDRLPAHRARE